MQNFSEIIKKPPPLPPTPPKNERSLNCITIMTKSNLNRPTYIARLRINSLKGMSVKCRPPTRGEGRSDFEKDILERNG